MATDWTRGKIRMELERKGYSVMITLDMKHGLKPGTVSNAIGEPHQKGEEVIAGVLKKAPHKIWPSRYGRDGVRLDPQPAANYRRRRQIRQSQKVAAE